MDESSYQANEPRVDRPAIPAEYGVSGATEFVDWSDVEARLATDRVYWIATVGPGGRPRVRPIDGVYLDGTLWVGGSPETRWVRDVAVNPDLAVHLDGLEFIVMIEGEAEVLTSIGGELAVRLADASNAKFPEYKMTAAVYEARGAIAIRIRQVIAWTDITKNPTRFRFGS
jgi:nitroimidazol reductase NimA-like FMN-containing flavoprotein (pyridoxamine 5'-phosphate oxidase superfamily)